MPQSNGNMHIYIIIIISDCQEKHHRRETYNKWWEYYALFKYIYIFLSHIPINHFVLYLVTLNLPNPL